MANVTLQTIGTGSGAGSVLQTAHLQSAIGAYADEAYTNAKKLSGTGIVSGNPNINTSTETFIGQVRWLKPLNPQINIASLTDSTAGTGTSYTTDYSTYVKTVRTHGASQVNLAQVVSQMDGLAKIGRDFAETRAQDQHNAILAVLRGVATAELIMGTGYKGAAAGLGGQSWTNDPTSTANGFYIDLGSTAPVLAAPSTTIQGAARAEGFLQAAGMAWKDYEPEYAYLVISPQIMMSLRSANLVDQTTVTEGSINFNTIFGGKFRLIQTRATQGFSNAELVKINTGAGADLTNANAYTTFMVLPGALAMEDLVIPTPTEIFRDARAFKGGGSTDIWYRWGYVVHPAGYDWVGDTTAFPDNVNYSNVMDTTSKTIIASIAGSWTGSPSTVTGTWARKASSVLSLGILPIMHG